MRKLIQIIMIENRNKFNKPDNLKLFEIAFQRWKTYTELAKTLALKKIWKLLPDILPAQVIILMEKFSSDLALKYFSAESLWLEFYNFLSFPSISCKCSGCWISQFPAARGA